MENAMKQKQLVILGQPITKKNSQVIRCINGYPLVNQSKAYRAYEKMALKELLAYPGQTITGPVTVRVHYWLRDRRRPDLTNLLQATADILEKAKVISNDRNIVSWDGSRIMGVSRQNPRAEIMIRPVCQRMERWT
jgi:Holliday junction resolvase RusA-like endonuclease